MAKRFNIDTWPYIETNLGTFGHTPVSGQLFTIV